MIKLSFGANSGIFLCFLILKLTEVIDWSWWWITCPLWIPLGLYMFCFIAAGIFAVLLDEQ